MESCVNRLADRMGKPREVNRDWLTGSVSKGC